MMFLKTLIDMHQYLNLLFYTLSYVDCPFKVDTKLKNVSLSRNVLINNY